MTRWPQTAWADERLAFNFAIVELLSCEPLILKELAHSTRISIICSCPFSSSPHSSIQTFFTERLSPSHSVVETGRKMAGRTVATPIGRFKGDQRHTGCADRVALHTRPTSVTRDPAVFSVPHFVCGEAISWTLTDCTSITLSALAVWKEHKVSRSDCCVCLRDFVAELRQLDINLSKFPQRHSFQTIPRWLK